MDKSRAFYGVDAMIDQDFNAKVLEVTFAPDMDRFTKFCPDGYNELMGCLFFNEEKGLTKII